MSKIGINISINVSKIEKTRLFKGKKGMYMDLTTYIDTENLDQYDNNGFINQSTSKEERESGVQTPILGNCKVFFNEGGIEKTDKSDDIAVVDELNDDIPF